jgi:hypothetical protein
MRRLNGRNSRVLRLVFSDDEVSVSPRVAWRDETTSIGNLPDAKQETMEEPPPEMWSQLSKNKMRKLEILMLHVAKCLVYSGPPVNTWAKSSKSGITHDAIMVFGLKQATMLMFFQRSTKSCGNMSLMGVGWQFLFE